MTIYSATAHTDIAPTLDHAVATATGQHRQLFFGQFVVMRREPRCLVCNCKERTPIEEMLFLGYGPAWIVSHLPVNSTVRLKKDGSLADDHTAAERIRSHLAKKHSHVEVTVGRAIQEHFSDQAGLELAGVSIVNGMGVMYEQILMGYEAMKRGEIRFKSMGELTSVISTFLTFQEKGGDSHAQVFQDALQAVMEELQANLDPQALTWIIAALESRPEIQSAARAIETSGEEQRALAG